MGRENQGVIQMRLQLGRAQCSGVKESHQLCIQIHVLCCNVCIIALCVELNVNMPFEHLAFEQSWEKNTQRGTVCCLEHMYMLQRWPRDETKVSDLQRGGDPFCDAYLDLYLDGCAFQPIIQFFISYYSETNF